MPHFNHGGISFHYLDEGDGMPFVFQHGLGGDVSGPAEVYQPQFGVRYVSMDARGHGATSALGNPADFRFDVLADDLIALLDHLGIEKAVVGGISMGAGEALNLALRYPHRVRGMVLVRPAWLTEPSPASLLILAQMGDWIQQEGVDGARRKLTDSAEFSEMVKYAPAAADGLLGQFTYPNLAATAPKYRAIVGDAPNRDATAWRKIRTPALVIGNPVDPTHPLYIAEELAAAIPGAKLAEVPSKSMDKDGYVHGVQAEIGAFLTSLLA